MMSSAIGQLHHAEVTANAVRFGTPGKFTLVCKSDPLVLTHAKRSASIYGLDGLEKKERLAELLLTTSEALQYLNAVVLPEKAFSPNAEDSDPIFNMLKESHVMYGVLVDRDVTMLEGTYCETTTKGLNDLGQRCREFYQAGARCALLSTPLSIGLFQPSKLAINENAKILAGFAVTCQENGLVPIVYPEILADGAHSIGQCVEANQRVLAACSKAFNDHNVLIEGTVLRINMVAPGSKAAKVSPKLIAEYTVKTLQRTIPAAIPAIVFNSGGLTEDEAMLCLNEMNVLDTKKPWTLSSSFGEEIEQIILKAWGGKEDNVKKAQQKFLNWCKANSEASRGTHSPRSKNWSLSGAIRSVLRYLARA